jgi:hypothetical protein
MWIIIIFVFAVSVFYWNKLSYCLIGIFVPYTYYKNIEGIKVVQFQNRDE